MKRDSDGRRSVGGMHSEWSGPDRLTREPPMQYPAAMINVTNRCNLTCRHCYLYKGGNPSEMNDQIADDELLRRLTEIRDRHGILAMVWMGGEPMIRWRLLERGVTLFARNTITTNGTIPLKEFGPTVTYVVSLDGPEPINDDLRSRGVYQRARKTISAVPTGFSPTIQVQCVVTRRNQDRLEELVTDFVDTPVSGMSFSFYCPAEDEGTELGWRDASEREAAVDMVLDLKRRYPGFIWSSSHALELMRAPTARLVTDNCPAIRTVLPLYVEDGQFVTPKCCHGNHTDCNRCGTWVVFSHAAKITGPWDNVVPRSRPAIEMSSHLRSRAERPSRG